MTKCEIVYYVLLGCFICGTIDNLHFESLFVRFMLFVICIFAMFILHKILIAEQL
jgi:hypothetical protein